VLRGDRLGCADRRLPLNHLMPPDVALRIHRYGLSGTPIYDDALDCAAARSEWLIRRGLELNRAAAAPAAVGRDEKLRAPIRDAILAGCRGKAAEHHRVDRARMCAHACIAITITRTSGI